jgi:peptidoglycan/LPS O-acetylase OafA/YrhL
LARIYPVHLAVIVLLAVLAAAGLVAGVKVDDPARFSFVGLLQNLLLMQGWGIGPRWSWNYPSWSVSSEWAGYLAFPVLFFYLSKLENIVVGQYAIVCWPILGLMGYFSGQGLNLAYADALPRFFLEFLWGVCTARMIPLFADELPTRGVAIAGLVFILIGTLIGAGAFALFGLWVVITSLTMNKDARRAPVFNRIGFLRPLGLISYSFYMSFATAELLIAQLFRHLGWHPADEKLVYTLAMIAVTSALAVSLYVLVEKPSRRALDRWMAPKPEPEPVVAPGKGKGKQQLARMKPRKMEVRE